jgi:hypothetical protein
VNSVVEKYMLRMPAHETNSGSELTTLDARPKPTNVALEEIHITREAQRVNASSLNAVAAAEHRVGRLDAQWEQHLSLRARNERLDRPPVWISVLARANYFEYSVNK